MSKTNIEWCDAVWNPTTGCSHISEGCDHCYAKRMANRLRGRCGYSTNDPFCVTLHPKRLEIPFKWKKPRRIFVNSMGDLFHGDVPEWFIDRVFGVMRANNQHTFMILTKRPERMLEYVSTKYDDFIPSWPLPTRNVLLGVSAEDQRAAEERVPVLFKCPAAKRFICTEPLLGPIRLDKIKDDELGAKWNALEMGINWVIAGAETGPKKRPMNLDWARSLRDQCQSAGVPYFFKKTSDGSRELDGQIWEEFPK